MIDVVAGVQICKGDHLTGLGRVDKLSATHIDAHMGEAFLICILEEYHIAGLQALPARW